MKIKELNNKLKEINIYNGHSIYKVSFSDINRIKKNDITEIVNLISTKKEKENDILFILESIYNVIKEKKEYKRIVDSLVSIYTSALNYKRYIYLKDRNNVIGILSYSSFIHESTVLADMCTFQMISSLEEYKKTKKFIEPKLAVEKYKQIKKDFEKDGLSLDEKYDAIYNNVNMVVNAKENNKALNLLNLKEDLLDIKKERIIVERKARKLLNHSLNDRNIIKKIKIECPRLYNKIKTYNAYLINNTDCFDFVQINKEIKEEKEKLKKMNDILDLYEEMNEKISSNKLELNINRK